MSGFEVFNDKVAVISGAASGLGQGFATVMAAKGAIIVAADINLEGVEKTVERIVEAGGRATAKQVDTRDSAAVERLVGSLEADTAAFRGRFAWTPPRTLADELTDAFAAGAPL